MKSVELKFLFDGVIFSTPVEVSKNSTATTSFEFRITFDTKYLIKRYAKGYKLKMENNRFSPVAICDKKEGELLQSLQNAIITSPTIASVMA